MKQRTSSQLGFSLAETLVALFILALVSAAGTSLLMGATATTKQLREAEGEARQIDIAQAMIRNDIAAMSVRAVVPESGIGRAGNLFGESGAPRGQLMSFVRSGWLNPDATQNRGTLQHVEYWVENGQLIRRARVRPDGVRSTPIAERVLFENVAQIEVAFEREGVRSREWVGDAGQALHILPDLIELNIVFEDERVLEIVALTGVRP